MENTLTRKKQIITAKALTTVIGITLSVAIPQLFHVIGIGISADASRRILHSSFGRSRGGCRNGSGKSPFELRAHGYAVGCSSSVYDDRAYRIRSCMRTPQKQKNARHFKGTHGSNTRKSHTRGCYFNRVLRL